MSLPYYKRYTRDLLDALVTLKGLELRGAYSIIIDLIYHHNGKLPDEPRYICGYLDCTSRKWANIKKSLIEAGKIELSGSYLVNKRAIIETKLRDNYQKTQSLNAQNRASTEENGAATAKPLQNQNQQPDTEPDIEVVVRGAREELPLIEKLFQASGNVLDRRKQGLYIDTLPARWISGKNAADLDLDVLPTISRLCEGKSPGEIGGWKYFHRAIFKARDMRLAGEQHENPEVDERAVNEKRNNNKRFKSAGERRAETEDAAALAAMAKYE